MNAVAQAVVQEASAGGSGSAAHISQQPVRGRRVRAEELSHCIADPDAVLSAARQPNGRVSDVDTKRGLQINLSTLQRARQIFNRLLA